MCQVVIITDIQIEISSNSFDKRWGSSDSQELDLQIYVVFKATELDKIRVKDRKMK